jgi:hypothetical protein
MPDERIDRSLSRRPASASATSIYTSTGQVVPEEWDALVERTPGTDVTQLSAWARVRASAGFSSLYVHAHRDGKLVGGAQLLYRRLPVVGRVGYVSYGPVVDHSATATATRSGPRSPMHFERWGHVGCG